MTSLKFQDIKKMNKNEMEKKKKELKMELIKSQVGASKGGASKIKKIKKIIARINTLNKSQKGGFEDK